MVLKNSLCAPAPLREKNKFQQQAATSPGYRRRRALTLSMSVHVRKHAGEVGYIVNAQYWNNGYATEASSAIMRWLESESGIHRIWATCDVDNLASARVLEKLGLVREGLLRRLTVRPNISELPRDAWMFAKVCGG